MNFYYPRVGGIQSLLHPMVEELEKNLCLGCEVIEISEEDESWIVKTKRGDELFFDELVSTIPLPTLIEILHKTPPEMADHSGNLKFNSVITIGLGLPRPNINDFSWLYIPDDEILPHRVSFPSNYSNRTSPRNSSSILAEVTCTYDDDIWNMSERRLTEQVLSDLVDTGIIDIKEAEVSIVTKNKFGYVINDISREHKVESIKEHVEDRGIHLLGRFSEFDYLNMDACIYRAMICAREI